MWSYWLVFCLPSDALSPGLLSYFGFSYLGHGVSLHGCSRKVKPLLLTLDVGYLLSAAAPALLNCCRRSCAAGAARLSAALHSVAMPSLSTYRLTRVSIFVYRLLQYNGYNSLQHTSPTRWTWVWVNSGSWWWPPDSGRPDVLQFMGSQRVRHDWATKLNWTYSTSLFIYFMYSCLYLLSPYS